MVGDPTLQGWLSTFLYLLAGLLLFAVGRNARNRALVMTGCVLAFLGINKQLDLHHSVLQTLRAFAIARDLRAYRIPLYVLVALIVLLLMVVASWMIWRARNQAFPSPAGRTLWLCGIFLLGIFIACRNAAFQHISEWRGSTGVLDSVWKSTASAWLWFVLEHLSTAAFLCAAFLTWRSRPGQTTELVV